MCIHILCRVVLDPNVHFCSNRSRKMLRGFQFVRQAACMVSGGEQSAADSCSTTDGPRVKIGEQ